MGNFSRATASAPHESPFIRSLTIPTLAHTVILNPSSHIAEKIVTRLINYAIKAVTLAGDVFYSWLILKNDI